LRAEALRLHPQRRSKPKDVLRISQSCGHAAHLTNKGSCMAVSTQLWRRLLNARSALIAMKIRCTRLCENNASRAAGHRPDSGSFLLRLHL
jgi:hypothetical protein